MPYETLMDNVMGTKKPLWLGQCYDQKSLALVLKAKRFDSYTVSDFQSQLIT